METTTSKNNKDRIFVDVAILIMTFLMVGTSEIFHNMEIIFPEIAAITIGSIFLPNMFWETDKIRILIYITLCAVLGVLIVLFCPGSHIVKLIFAFFLAQVIFILSGTSFAPMISAMVLPILLQTTSKAYLISAISFTALALVIRIIFEKTGYRQKETFEKIKRGPLDFRDLFVRVVIGAVLIILAIKSGLKFMMAPPLLVAFTELTNRETAPRKHPFKVILLMFLCALTGSLLRFIIHMRLNLPLTLAAVLAMGIFLFFFRKIKIYLPPAGAITILSFLIPEKFVLYYPIHVLIGISILMASALIFFRSKNQKEPA